MRHLLFLPFGLLTPLFISYHMERILRQLSNGIVSAIKTTHTQPMYILRALRDLTMLENRPEYLTEMAYEWCSTICERYQSSEDLESLLLASLEVGFRHLDPQDRWISARLTHTEHHRGLVDVVFESKDSEGIADLLQAWTTEGRFHEPADTLLGICTGQLVGLHNPVSFSSRLRRLVIRSVEVIGYEGFKEVGVERFVELLNHLHVGLNDTDDKHRWMQPLTDTIRSPKGARDLADQSWGLLLEIVILEQERQEEQEWVQSWAHALERAREWARGPEWRPAYSPHVMRSLLEAREWDKLEYWLGVVWMLWPPETHETTEHVESVMVALFQHRPTAIQKLAQWMERWSNACKEDIPESFQRICEENGAAQQDLP